MPWGVNPKFTNDGTFTKTAAGGDLTIFTPFVSSGTFYVKQGGVKFNSTAVQGGGLTVLDSTTTLKASTYQVTAGTFTTDAAEFQGTLQIDAGVLSAEKTSLPNQTPSPSQFAVRGNLILGKNSTLYVRMNQADTSVVNVTAPAPGLPGGTVTMGDGVNANTGGIIRFLVDTANYPAVGQKVFLRDVNQVGEFSGWNANAAIWPAGPGPLWTGITQVLAFPTHHDVIIAQRPLIPLRPPAPPVPPPPIPPGAKQIKGVVWADGNGNGVRDSVESRVTGVEVDLYDTTGAIVTNTWTDANGNYTLYALPGTYSLTALLPSGSAFTAFQQGSDPTLYSNVDPATGMSAPLVVSSNGPDLLANIGLLTAPIVPDPSQPGSTSGTVVGRAWQDVNANGIQDAGEASRSGVQIRLTDANSVVFTTQTDSLGYYSFTGVALGNYSVSVSTPSGSTFTGYHQGTDPTLDSDFAPTTGLASGTLTSANPLATLDAGFVAMATTTTTLTANTSNSFAGQAITLTATVSPSSFGGTPTGTVTFMDGNVSLGSVALTTGTSGTQAVLSIATLSVGGHSLTAVYSGSATYTGSTSTALTETVHIGTVTEMLASSNPSVLFGTAVTFTATIYPSSQGFAPTGTIAFYDGNTLLATISLSHVGNSYQATFTISTLSRGSHSISAVYSGDQNFLGATSSLTEFVS